MITSPRCRPENQQGHKFRVQIVQSDPDQFEIGPIFQSPCSTITNLAALPRLFSSPHRGCAGSKDLIKRKAICITDELIFFLKNLLLRSQTGKERLIFLNNLPAYMFSLFAVTVLQTQIKHPLQYHNKDFHSPFTSTS